MTSLRMLSAMMLAACGAPDAATTSASAAPVTTLVGQVELHQFPAGSHAWALFLPAPIPVDAVHTDQLVQIEAAPVAVEGPCQLFVPPRCTPACATGSWCAATDDCQPLAPLVLVDGGEVDVTGSLAAPDVRLYFAGPGSVYASVPPPGPVELYAGGERLHAVDADPRLGFDGKVQAPLHVAVSAPDPDAALAIPPGALPVRWTGTGAEAVAVFVSSSSRVDPTASAVIRCVTADLGALDVPADMIAALPPPPRDERVEVERIIEEIVPTHEAGAGVLLRAAFSWWKNGSE